MCQSKCQGLCGSSEAARACRTASTAGEAQPIRFEPKARAARFELPVSFRVAILTDINGVPFQADEECDDASALQALLDKLSGVTHSVDRILMYFDLSKPNGGCHILEDHSEQLLVEVFQELGLTAESFLNEAIGSYDPFTNRVEPANLGTVFPDGSMRILWSRDTAKADFATTRSLVHDTLEVLLKAQEMAYGQETEAEINDFAPERRIQRVVEMMFACGVWPDEDDKFQPVADIDKALAPFARKAIPT